MAENKIKTAAEAACNAIIYNGVSIQSRQDLVRKIEEVLTNQEQTASSAPESQVQVESVTDEGNLKEKPSNETAVTVQEEKALVKITDETFSPNSVNSHLSYSLRSKCASCGKLLMAYNDRQKAKVIEAEGNKYFVCENCLQNPDLNEIYKNIKNTKQRHEEYIEQRRSIQTVSYVGKSVLTLLLYRIYMQHRFSIFCK